jgi:hypothetical protein
MNAVTFLRLGFSYTLPKTNCDSYACQKTKFTSSENYSLTSRGDIVPFRLLKLNVRKGNCRLPRYEETGHNSPKKTVSPSEITEEGKSVHGEL